MAVAPITSIKGIGPRRAEAFGRLGLFSVEDMLSFMPRVILIILKACLCAKRSRGCSVPLR